jgi:hypothetical protein
MKQIPTTADIPASSLLQLFLSSHETSLAELKKIITLYETRSRELASAFMAMEAEVKALKSAPRSPEADAGLIDRFEAQIEVLRLGKRDS